ncbi:MAG: MBL fold metallo-hydrolase [Candidatus Sumerlaeota bacterium]|nr:MBL fold metallo-hydrolase [Candidatus Sumerlaeota bacterium]
MLSVTPIINDLFASCAYIVSRADCLQALVIDPADDASGHIAAFLREHALSDIFIALTHEHFDHIAGVERLRQQFGAQVVCSRACSESIGRPEKNFSRYLTGIDRIFGPSDLICEEVSNAIDWCDERIEFVPTPGHSPGSVCIAVCNALFTGDTLIKDLRTVTKLPGGNRTGLRKSINLLLTRFPAATMVYPGHGEPFRLSQADREVILGNIKS